jgi:phosphatidylglycerol---prolipoprotein diacylglyceryl transferase
MRGQRIGCSWSVTTTETPSALPWAVAFPEGLPPTTVPVHPTQLYEAIGLGLLGWILIQWRRRGVSDATVLGQYLVAAGVLRCRIEFLRVNERVAFGLSVAHLDSLAAIVLGGIVFLVAHPTRRTVSSGSRLP